MSDITPKILADLPTIQRIADRVNQQNPLIAVVVQQALALSEISGWSASCQNLLVQEQATAAAEGAPTVGEVFGVPDESVEVVPTPMTPKGRAKNAT